MIHQPLEILPHGCGRKSNYLPADSRLIIHENKMRRTCSRIHLLHRNQTKTGWGVLCVRQITERADWLSNKTQKYYRFTAAWN
jgi:hypothetical protein